MWAIWAVGLTVGLLGNATTGHAGLAVAFGLLLAADLAGAAILHARRAASAATKEAAG